MRAAAPARRRPAARAPPRGPPGRARARRALRQPRRAIDNACELQRVRERLAAMGEGALDDARMPAKPSGSGSRRNATSAESTFGGGWKTVRETGWKPVRDAASWTSTETAPYAFVDGAAKKRSATSRCTITHQRSTVGRPSRLSATIGVATLYGRFATSFVGGGSSAARSRLERVAPVERDVRRCCERAELRLEATVELDGVDVRAPLGEDAASARRARGRSRARRRRGRARRAAR